MNKVLGLLCILLIGCTTGFSNEEIPINEERGNKIIVALNDFYLENAIYPNDLSSLIPNYIDVLPINTHDRSFYYQLHTFHGYKLCFDAQEKPRMAGCCYYPKVGQWDCSYGH